MQPPGSEGHAVVGANGLGQAEFAEGSFEDRTRMQGLGVGQGAAGQQIARVQIADGERETPDPRPWWGIGL